MKQTFQREAARFLCKNTYTNRTSIAICRHFKITEVPSRQQRRSFGITPTFKAVKPYLLADIGEGITECQVIQWFVSPGARVEQFDPICEVQSDKASVEITSRFDGVIKKLYYEPDDMAKVGKPLVDIDIQSEISAADETLLTGGSEKEGGEQVSKGTEIAGNASAIKSESIERTHLETPISSSANLLPIDSSNETTRQGRKPGKHASLATPAVRHWIKESKLNIEDIEGTGKEGRVTKEDVQRHMETVKRSASPTRTTSIPTPMPIQVVQDHVKPLTLVQMGMYKQMTRSLSIPHFLYTDNVDFTALNVLRKRLNARREKSHRLTTLPFIVKALSLALQQYPLLNAHLDNTTNPQKPQLVVKGSHDIGIAVDSPAGLLVPVIRNVQSHSIESLALEILQLGTLARTGKLTSRDLSGATFTLSNIGSIGGTAVAPVIVSPQVGILGIGRARIVPAFGENGELVKKEDCVFSWSADHRVIDGAMAARCAEVVRGYLENVETMLITLR